MANVSERAQGHPVTAGWLQPRPGWKPRTMSAICAVAYFVLAFVCAVLVSNVLKSMTGLTLAELLRDGPNHAMIGHASLLFAVAIVPSTIMLLIAKQDVRQSGWDSRLAALRLLAGAIVGFGAMGAVVAAF